MSYLGRFHELFYFICIIGNNNSYDHLFSLIMWMHHSVYTYDYYARDLCHFRVANTTNMVPQG